MYVSYSNYVYRAHTHTHTHILRCERHLRLAHLHLQLCRATGVWDSLGLSAAKAPGESASLSGGGDCADGAGDGEPDDGDAEHALCCGKPERILLRRPGVWCVVYGVWCVVCGVRCVVYGVWCVVCVYKCSVLKYNRVCVYGEGVCGYV